MKEEKSDLTILFEKRGEILQEDNMKILLEESDKFAAINAFRKIVFDVQTQNITYRTTT